MKREIKFRGYSNDHGWIHGDLLRYPDGKVYIMEHSDGESLSYEVDPESVGQYTGFDTIREVPVYEGDVLDFVDQYRGRRRCVVVWRDNDIFLEELGGDYTHELLDDVAWTSMWVDYSYKPRDGKDT